MLLYLTCLTSFDAARIYYRMGQAASWSPIVYYRLNCRRQSTSGVIGYYLIGLLNIVCVLLYFGWVTSTGIISYYLIGLINIVVFFGWVTSTSSVPGSVDSNWNVAAVLEKKLLPMPFTLTLSGMLNHKKSNFRLGLGFVIG